MEILQVIPWWVKMTFGIELLFTILWVFPLYKVMNKKDKVQDNLTFREYLKWCEESVTQLSLSARSLEMQVYKLEGMIGVSGLSDIKKKLKEVQAKLKDLKKPIRSFRIILGIAIAIAIMWTVNVMGAAFYLRNYQEHLLIGKMQHMQELRTVLQKKGEEINSLKAGYKTDIEALTAQIREEQATKGVKSYADAEKDAAIAYDLSLIQKKQAYISKLDDISHKINSSILEINYLCESIRTDLPMVKTLGKKEIAVLTNRLKAIDQKSLTKTLEMPIAIDQNQLPSRQKIWEEIVKKK